MFSFAACAKRVFNIGRRLFSLSIVASALPGGGIAQAPAPVVLDRSGATVSLEAYSPNIIRVTLSLDKKQATAAPGYGLTEKPATQGWTLEQNADGDAYSSSRLIVTVGSDHHRGPAPLPSQLDIAKYFNGSAPGAHITVRTVQGKKLIEMIGWSMSVPNHKDATAGVLHDKRASDLPFFQVGATFVSPADEHYYGLGQNQEGYLDHRGHTVLCWHDYTAIGG
ncbi:MAG: alpha-glucosidase, partial [Nitrospirota bacterium]|nr:alpha-glucosidase [Nitrospirota bacterium]